MAITIDIGDALTDGTANSATEVNTKFTTMKTDIEDALSFITEITDGLEFKTTNVAAGSIKTISELEWDPSDGSNLTDNASGIAIDFVMPDDADNQDVFARVVGMVRDDSAGAEEGELSFRGIDGGSADTEWLTVSGAGLTTTLPASVGAMTVTSLNVGDGNITNVGDIALDSISGDGDSDSNITFAGSDVITLATGGTEAWRVNASQLMIVGGTSYGDARFTVERSGDVQIALAGQMAVGKKGIQMDFDTGSDYGTINATHRGTAHKPLYLQSTAQPTYFGGNIFIGDTANANMTQGLTINQGANDDEILAFKSSDVAHGMTAFAETDTYAFFDKNSATGGGLRVHGLEDVQGSNQAIQLYGVGWSENTDDTTASVGIIRLRGARNNGAGAQALSATGNLLSVDNEGTTRMVLKGNGDMHITNTTLTALDAEDDIALVRASQVAMSDGMGIAMDEWDEHLKATEDDLRRVGVLRGDFINVQRYNSLIGGSVVQLYKRMMQHAKTIEENIPQLKGKLLPEVN